MRTSWRPDRAGVLAASMLALALLAGTDSPPSPVGSKAGEARVRRPVALALALGGARLYVANRRAGSLSVVDPKAGRVVAEFDVGGEVVDLACRPDGRLVLVDRSGGALILARVSDRSLEVEARQVVAADPASVLLDPDGAMAVVASTASHRLTVIDLPLDASEKVAPRLARSIPLPFAPRLLAWADPGMMLVAADADGGRLALVDPLKDLPESVRSIPAHNIRGLARTPDGLSLVVAHQTLNRLARSTFEDVHWGALIGNHVRFLDLAAVLDPGANLLTGSRLVDLGRTGRAAGDPGAIAFDGKGRPAVALEGVHELVLLPVGGRGEARRVGVGQGPSAVLASPDGARIYVAASMDDAVAIVAVEAGATVRTIPLGPRPEPGPVERGERLFADARLSHDGWMSCRSCHGDGRAGVLSADTLADGGVGAPKRVPPLFGVGHTGPWTWLGAVPRLEDQVRKSVETTMRGKAPTADQVTDLTAYLRSLPPYRPTLAADQPEAEVARGRSLFKARKCAECHAPPSYTSEGTFDVGLLDEAGHREFNPPSLLGVGDRPPYLHDGRAASLPEVFLRHRHPRDATWTPEEVEALTAFLRTL